MTLRFWENRRLTRRIDIQYGINEFVIDGLKQGRIPLQKIIEIGRIFMRFFI